MAAPDTEPGDPGSAPTKAAPPALAHQLARAELKARLFGAPAESARIGRYAVLRKLGAGGMGVVYAAYDEQLDRKIAIKLVHPDRHADGCPDEVPRTIPRGVIRGIYFDLDRDTIKPRSRPVLDRAVAIFTEFPDVRVAISGHTDSTGAPAYNRYLSQRRASAVKRYLVEHGIDAARIETRGAGPDEPIDTNRTPAGRAKNRRIEFELIIDRRP